MKLQYEKMVVNIVKKRVNTESEIEFLGRKNLSRWIEFKNRDYILQPDIDMLLCKKINRQRYTPLHAVEFKTFYFKENNERLNYSYYAGLDESLALLNFGIDYVSLFQVFIFEVYDFHSNPNRHDRQIENYFKYTDPIRYLIKSLKLPIGYTVAFTFSENGEITNDSKVEILDNLSNPEIVVIKAKKNKIEGNGRTIRKTILKKLNIKEDKSFEEGPLIR